MTIESYINPTRYNSFASIQSELQLVLKHHQNQLLIATKHRIFSENKNLVISAYINNNFSLLSHGQLSLIQKALVYIGAIDFNESGEMILSNDDIDFKDPRFFRYCEDDLITQLILLKYEAYEANQIDGYSFVNDKIFSFKKKYNVYGYLRYIKSTKEYEFLIREIYYDEPPFYLDPKDLYSKIMAFKKYCKRAGIHKLVIEPRSDFAYFKPVAKSLKDAGVVFLGQLE